MTYIILAAGKGDRLHPLTLSMPKSMYKLDKDMSVLQRMVESIKKYDPNSNVVIVTGFKREIIEKDIKNVIFINNPFYSVTNSIASLWFAKDYLLDENVTIINADIVMQEELVEMELCKKVEKPMVFIDSSIKTHGDYNVQVKDNKILVMSKQLQNYFGEYAGVTKLDKISAKRLYSEVVQMVEVNGIYDQWYENVLVQMIFNEDFELFYRDISEFRWTEIDCVEDMLLAKDIHSKDKRDC